MDLGNIIYIIAVLAYFVYQATKKKRGEVMPEDQAGNPEPPQKGLTFEELLREIRNAQNPAPAQPEPVKAEVPKPIPAPIPGYQGKTPSKKPVVLEEVDDEVRHYEGSFEGTKKNPYAAYKETHSIPSTPLKRMDYEALATKKVNPYAELLKNPKSLKQAVIVSEILRPKHF